MRPLAMVVSGAGALALIALALWFEPPGSTASGLPRVRSSAPDRSSGPLAPALARTPPDGPPRVSCDDARRIVALFRADLPVRPQVPAAEVFAAASSDWLDPHGLWSMAPDTPLSSRLVAAAPDLVRELEESPRAGACGTALALGDELGRWVRVLRARAMLALMDAPTHPEFAPEHLFETGAVTRRASALTDAIARSLRDHSDRHGDVVDPFVVAALDRFFPSLTGAEWSEVVLAAAVRAYIPSREPHSAWAPSGQGWLLSEPSHGDRAPRLWDAMRRTAIGVEIGEGSLPGLEPGDIVLDVDGTPLAGLSVEQVEGLARIERGRGDVREYEVLVIRGAARPLQPVRLRVSLTERPSSAPFTLSRVRYGAGSTLVVRLEAVTDELAHELGSALAESFVDESPVGVLLDLRGNVGGSVDAARVIAGAFMPGATLFSALGPGGAVSVGAALDPVQGAAWAGPLALLVDGGTASAAEIIAGAVLAYRRGPVVGVPTFGKGTMQRFSEVTGVGTLRHTTLLFARPDGVPVQGVGLTPTLSLATGKLDAVGEQDIPGALSSWAGSDVRSLGSVGGPVWPPSDHPPGPCPDPGVCAALSLLNGAFSGATAGGDTEPASAPRRRR